MNPYNKLWNIFICWGQYLWISKISLVRKDVTKNVKWVFLHFTCKNIQNFEICFYSWIFFGKEYPPPYPSKLPNINDDALQNELQYKEIILRER